MSYKAIVEAELSASPLTAMIGSQIVEFCDRLSEISTEVNKGADPDAPKKPTIGVVLNEAKDNENVAAEYAAYIEARDFAKAQYRALFVSLHPEFADSADDDDVDDSERKVLIEEAKEIWSKIKSGFSFLETQPTVSSDTLKALSESVPVVEGARMRTSTSEGSTIRPRFVTVDISGPDGANASVKTFTDAAKFISSKGDKIASSDLAEAWVNAGGSSETESGTEIRFNLGEWALVTVKA